MNPRPGPPRSSRIRSGHSADEPTREQIFADAAYLVRHKHWEAAAGFDLTDEMVTVIAAHAARLVVDLGTSELREVSAVIVYPTTVVSVGEHAGPISGTVSDGSVPVLGEAHDRRGPVILAWDQVQADAHGRGTGENVVLHEFAHKLDMVDGLVNGAPPLSGRVDPARWAGVCREVFEGLQWGERPPVRAYGATNPAEFFAVATEAFFEAAEPLRRHEPDLYDILRDYYGQDPAVATTTRA